MSQLVRIATAGSVDDGKSTLIGRLLHDTRTLPDDQLADARRAGEARGDDHFDLALLTDGLRAEREQGITIDVAYRYFSTPRRTFILADTPGHVQYTRNMVTGASTADVALVLIDATAGVLQQSRRHAFLAALLGVEHMVVCINKMDLVGWSNDRFEEISDDFATFAARLEIHDVDVIPISALHGDNVVTRSAEMPWYDGPTLLGYLEHVHVAGDRNLIDARFPVQYVIRPMTGDGGRYRGLAGTVASGVFHAGDELVVLPSGRRTRLAHIDTPDGELDHAPAGAAVTFRLADDVDVSRGDMLCRPRNRPHVGHELDALVCWMSDHDRLRTGQRLLLKHTTRSVRCEVDDVLYRVDVDTLGRTEAAEGLGLNEIGRVRLRCQAPLLYDPYRQNRSTGGFILIDDATDDTVAAGMLLAPQGVERPLRPASPDVVWQQGGVTRDERWQALGTTGCTVWLTGLSGAGKSTVAAEIERLLLARGRWAFVLDGDNVRHGLNADLGFGATDRAENIRRLGEVARLFAEAGAIAVVSAISPYERDRSAVRQRHLETGLPFVEVWVATPLDECERRDPKGLYRRARAGELRGFTGIDDPYEEPLDAEIVLTPDDGDAVAQARLVVAALERR